MKRRKPKPKWKPKRKVKRKPKQHPSSGTEQVVTHGESEEPGTAVKVKGETEEPASIVEIPIEIRNSASSAEIGDTGEDSSNAVEVKREIQDLASIIEIQVEIENSVSPAEIRDPNDYTAGPLEIYDGTEIPTLPVGIPIDTVKRAPHSAPPTGVDRRAHPRYAFTGAIEVGAAALGAQIKTQVRDLSQQGCYVDTDSPLALGTPTDVRIVKGARTFDARARVVYNQTGKGMGLMFIAMEPEQRTTLDAWITESRESSWRSANRRRSQRALMKVPVQVSGQTASGVPFDERSHTLSISAHGALIVMAAPVHRGQRFILSNMQTKAALECVVVHLERRPGEPTQVGLEFMLPNQTFWRVSFPPKDWTPRHPDAKVR
jgi:PilZ domain